jgi:predicted aspartyl protease
MNGGLALLLAAAVSACTPPASTSPDWIEAFDYKEAEVYSLDVGDFGFPYVPVRIGGTPVMLPFDTGNMVGLSVSSELFDQLGLMADDHYNRVNSAGEITATLRVAEAYEVSILGRELDSTRIYELDHPSLPGLVGPSVIEYGHFTLDYGSGRIGMGSGHLPDSVPGFQQVALVRSSRHPKLILVRGTIEGRSVLIELDTGKSRTVINPVLSSELALERGSNGVAINSLSIGDLSFEVRRAKEVNQTGIDPSLPDPILAGIGSDILSRFVWTVDYDTGVLWIPAIINNK